MVVPTATLAACRIAPGQFPEASVHDRLPEIRTSCHSVLTEESFNLLYAIVWFSDRSESEGVR
jgi:hypothetical protein